MGKTFGNAKLPSLKDKIREQEEAVENKEVDEKKVKTQVEKGRAGVKVKTLSENK